MPTMNFNGKGVTDTEVKDVLQAMADFFEKDVVVTSGDRGTPLNVGGKGKSLHLKNQAADFHIAGMDEGTAYLYIKVFASAMFASEHGYEFIWHGPHTETMGQRLHLGRYGSASPGYVKFKKESITNSEKGIYRTDIKMPLYWTFR